MQQEIINGLAGGLFICWILMCIVKNEEGCHKNVKTFGRFAFTISGARDRVYDKDTMRLKPGKNTLKFQWIWFGFQWVSWYRFGWKEPRKSSSVAVDDRNITSGDPRKHAEVSYSRHEWTNHHRDQEDYRFDVKDIETGEKEGKVAQAGQSPENVKIDSSLQGTVRMECPFEAQYRNSAKWHQSLEATIYGTLGEIISTMVYAELPKIRGEKLGAYPVENSEPKELPEVKDGEPAPKFYFADKDGKRRETVTFLERVNYEIMQIKRLGVSLINIVLLDYDASESSKPYLTSLQKRAISEINLQSAKNDAESLKAGLTVKGEFIKGVIKQNEESTKNIMGTENVTQVKVAQAQPNLRVRVEAPNSGGIVAPVDVNKLINTALGLDIAEEIRSATDEPDEKKSTHTKKPGGRK